MCGRYYINDEVTREIKKIVRKTDPGLMEKRDGDIYPSQSAPVITGREPELALENMLWGFPQYSRNGLLINARSETVLERKMFRDSVLRRRCIIPAGHFYEWDSQKNKISFLKEDSPILFMAGFYNQFQGVDRFVILTTEANSSVRPVHSRMPLILEKNELQNWIYDEQFLDFALHKTSPPLSRYQEYEQQSLF